MDIIQTFLQVVVALGIFNVWLLRGQQSTPYRGGAAGNLREEFANYGLPPAALFIVGGLKIACAVALLVGIVLPGLVAPAALLLAALMLGALGMHLKVKDPPIKSLPAALMLAMSLVIFVI